LKIERSWRYRSRQSPRSWLQKIPAVRRTSGHVLHRRRHDGQRIHGILTSILDRSVLCDMFVKANRREARS
jgi:hypothetical protein